VRSSPITLASSLKNATNGMLSDGGTGPAMPRLAPKAACRSGAGERGAGVSSSRAAQAKPS
jgi:hypothetical protein